MLFGERMGPPVRTQPREHETMALLVGHTHPSSLAAYTRTRRGLALSNSVPIPRRPYEPLAVGSRSGVRGASYAIDLS